MRWCTVDRIPPRRTRGTSVGTLAIDRLPRPVCFQNFPDALLPDAPKNSNPLGIDRRVNGEKTRDSVA
jgi:NADP-dependent aldehyde dehydrogenase